ncbi:hypothetical protein N0V82_006929 [Gnomoniopsis sp. IMI 355080]|nr:hypothetical protein N0V82_006929 [Gnomoniopsis sp. IMI 355080]
MEAGVDDDDSDFETTEPQVNTEPGDGLLPGASAIASEHLIDTIQLQTSNLWQQAFAALDREHQEWLDFTEQDNFGPVSPDAIINMINNSRADCERKQWVLFINKKGDKVLLRDVLGKICEWAQKFQKIGDAAVEYVVQAAIPWAIIKSLMQMTINDCQTFGKMLESIENVSKIITWYTELEARLLIRTSALTRLFSSSLVDLYAAALQYLAKTHHYYRQSTLKRVFKSTFTSAKELIEEPMLKIEGLEDVVHKRATIVAQDFGISMVKNLLSIIENHVKDSKVQISERRARLSVKINGIHTQDTFQAALGYHHKGTCDWVFRLDEFREWTADDTELSKLLWIHGPPGFGKTITSAWIIQHLRESCHRPVAYFFCVAENERTRDPYAILRSWLLQLLEGDDGIIDIMESFFGRLKQDEALTFSQLWELFIAACQATPGCTFVLDGFDECTNIIAATHYHKEDSRSDFLRGLVLNLHKVNARVLVMSRDVSDIRECLSEENVTEGNVIMWEYSITAKDTNDDVESFSTHVMAQKLPKKPIELRQQLASEATNRSEGMFLWIQLLEKDIYPGQNAKQLHAAVHDMPSGIGEAYSRDLGKIERLPKKQRTQAIMILRWVLFAIRPLQVKVLAEALVVSDSELKTYPRDDLPDEWEDNFVDEDYVNSIILGFCGALLRLRSRSHGSPIASHTVHFVHFSVKEYLLATHEDKEETWAGKFGLADSSAEEEFLSQVCLRYLTLDVFEDIPAETRLYPLLSYASWAWYFHSFHKKPRPGPGIMVSTQRAFDPATSSWKVWTPVLERKLVETDRANTAPLLGEFGDSVSDEESEHQSSVESDTGSSSTEDETLTEEAAYTSEVQGSMDLPVLSTYIHLENPIYYASLLGLTEVVDWLADQGLEVNCVGGRFGCPLQAAAARGHTEVIARLLNRNAPINQTGGLFHTALIAAAALSTPGTVGDLLDAEADVSLRDKEGLTALDHAASRGAIEIVEVLLEHGAECTAAAKRLACQAGHRDILKLLMDRGDPLDIVKDKRNISALDKAMLHSHIDVVIDVIETLPAAAISAQLCSGRTLLHHAVIYGALEVVQTLLQCKDNTRRSDVNQVDSEGWSILQEACFQGYVEIVRALVLANANVAHEGLGMTPLSVSAVTGNCDIIRVLQEAGADIDQRTHGTVTALSAAVNAGTEAAVKLLLDLGASIVGIDEHTQQTLYSAACNSDPAIAELLIDHGCFGTANDDKNQRSDVDRRLSLLASRKHAESGQCQLDWPAELRTQPTELFPELLRIAAFSGNLGVVENLLSLGVRPNSKDVNGRTALHYAALTGHETNYHICELLIKYGASISIEDDVGSTPLDLAAFQGSRAVLFVQRYMVHFVNHIIRRPSLLMTPVSDGQTTRCTSPSQVRKALSGQWKGHYEYLEWESGRQDPWTVRFSEIEAAGGQNEANDLETGLVTRELDFSSSGDDTTGSFELHGFVDPKGIIWFVKLYEDRGWLYKGSMSADMNTIKGTWGGNRKLWYGTFLLNCGA